MITADELHTAISNFAATISQQQLGLVYYLPHSDAEATYCFANVFRYVENNGGAVKFGWTFHHRCSTDYGDYLFATHHAVWHSFKGPLIDITPFHDDPKHHPITEDNSILFLLDDNAEPIVKGNIMIPLPLRYFAIKQDVKLKKYVDELHMKELNHYKKQYGISIEL